MRYSVRFLLHESPNVVRMVNVELSAEEIRRVKLADDPEREAEVFAVVRAAHQLHGTGDYRWWGDCKRIARRCKPPRAAA